MTDDHKADSRLIGVLALGVMTLLAASLFAMLFVPVPEQNRESVSLLIGAVISLATAVISYFFGRTVGERKKDQTIDTMAETMKAGSESVTIQPPVTITEAKSDESA